MRVDTANLDLGNYQVYFLFFFNYDGFLILRSKQKLCEPIWYLNLACFTAFVDDCYAATALLNFCLVNRKSDIALGCILIYHLDIFHWTDDVDLKQACGFRLELRLLVHRSDEDVQAIHRHCVVACFNHECTEWENVHDRVILLCLGTA